MSTRLALLFAGGPAPAANAVLNAAAMTLRRAGVEVLGIRDGYAALQSYDAVSRPLVEGKDWFVFRDEHLRGLRNDRGVLIGTSRAHPGRGIRSAEDLADPERSAGLKRVWDGLRSLGVTGLMSIGGDGTLRTANMLLRWQELTTPEAERVAVVHVPKTIDNDYRGIDFTFGFFTAVDTIAGELLNLRADALATSSWFVVECMGRRAGWLSYGVAIAGEAHLVVGVEDIDAELTDADGALDLDRLVDRIVGVMASREARGKAYGTVVLAEGLVERLGPRFFDTLPKDTDGNVYGLGSVQLGRLVAQRCAARYRERFGRDRKVTGVQLGYESRCAVPHAFDVVLGCQLGAGAAKALLRGQTGVMVSASGAMELRYVPFQEIVDPVTLTTEVRYVPRDSDFRALAHALGTRRG
jgi:6-phosphofructokinase